MKRIGILGGVGPEATIELYREIIRATPASSDQDHLPCIIIINPQVPDRTEAILRKGPSPVPELVKTSVDLDRAGADFIVMPCTYEPANGTADERDHKTLRSCKTR